MTESAAPRLSFRDGFALLLRSVGLVLRAGPVRSWFVFTLASSAVCLAVCAFALWPLAGQVVSWLWVDPADAQGLKHWAALALEVVTYLVLLLASALVVPPLAMAPWLDAVSEAVEKVESGAVPPPFSLSSAVKTTGVALVHTVVRITVTALVWVLLLPIHFIPVAGSVAHFAFAAMASCTFLAFEHLATPSARHSVSIRSLAQLIRPNLRYALGLGAALFALIAIPFGALFVAPLRAVAGTLGFIELRRSH